MVPTRPFLLAAMSALPLSLVACGSSSGEGAIVPEGTHYGYVVSKVSVPAKLSDLSGGTFSLDLGATKSNTPDGTKDNRLGEALQFLTMAGFKLQDTIDTAVNAGSILLLVDFQTKDFTSTNAAGLGVKLGVKATAMPAPCSSATDTVCGHHLTGTGVFTVDPSSPTNALLGGKIVGGKFSGGPGDVSLQIAISAGSPPLTLSLLNARA